MQCLLNAAISYLLIFHKLHHYFPSSITTSYHLSLLSIIYHYFPSSITTSHHLSVLLIIYDYFISSITTSYHLSLLHIIYHYFISSISGSDDIFFNDKHKYCKYISIVSFSSDFFLEHLYLHSIAFSFIYYYRII